MPSTKHSYLTVILVVACLSIPAFATAENSPVPQGASTTEAGTLDAPPALLHPQPAAASTAQPIPFDFRRWFDTASDALEKTAPWVGSWVRRDLASARMLSFSAIDSTLWALAGTALLASACLAALLRGDVEACADAAERHPGHALLAALLSLLSVPLVTALLVFTGIGALLIPLGAAVLAALIFFGGTVMLAAIGRMILPALKLGGTSRTVSATVLAGLLCAPLHAVPGLGALLWLMIAWLGFGGVMLRVTAQFRLPAMAPTAPGAARFQIPSSIPPKAPTSALLTTVPQLGSSVVIHGSPSPAAVLGNLPVRASEASSAPSSHTTTTAGHAVMPHERPRAGFWARLTALLIDLLLVGVACALVARSLPGGKGPAPSIILCAFSVYAAVGWRYWGTTLGGAVCALHVEDAAGQRPNWGTVAVRLLGGLLSLASGGLGFVWIALYPGRQAWHDRLAGTEVLSAPGA